MDKQVRLRTFPANEYEAVAMLYVKQQDLSGLTPEQILDLYQDAYEKVCHHQRAKREQQIAQYD